MNTESQTDRITQLEASCAAMREALAQSKGVLIKASNMHDMVKCSNFIDSFVMGYTIDKALSTDAGKSLFNRLEKAESEASDLKESLALELAENIKLFDLLGLRTPGDFEHNTSTEAVTIKVKALLDRLQAVERDNGLLKEQIRVADVAYQSLHERHQSVEAERDRYKVALETLEIGLPEVGASFLREEVRLVARKAL